MIAVSVRILAVLALIAGIAVALLVTLFTPPGQLNLIDRASGSGAGVAEVAEAVPFGDHGQTLDIWAPAGTAEGANKPVLVFFYGGGWAKGAREEYGFAGRAFAAEDYVVVVPDYRKVPDVRFPAFLEDGAAALAWVRQNIARYGGDPDRIAVAGHSAGAYIAIMLALDPQWLRAAGARPDTIKAAVGLSGPYDFYPFDSPRSKAAFGQEKDPRITQPITYARADAPPMLLVTSSADTTVKPRNAEALSARLAELGATVEMRNYAGLTHEDVVMALSRPFRGKGPVLADSLAFLKANLPKP